MAARRPLARRRKETDDAPLVVHDETATGRPVGALTLPEVPDSITLRELVRLRVREEVARHHAAPTGVFQGLVQPTDTEVAANGFRLLKPHRIDWESQADVAEAAFARNGFFILVDDHQAESLDEVISLVDDPHVAFVKLTPLVGG